jgi:hypothetical protein
MPIFTALQYNFPATEKFSKRKGILKLFTQIKLKGNPNKGSIPVEVAHKYQFHYDKPWLDENSNEIYTVQRAFDTYEERNIYCKRFFVSKINWDDIEYKRNA